MSVREDFPIGMRVKVTAKALRNGLRIPPDQMATVTGHTGSPLSIKVRRDGYQTSTPYHRDFWAPTEEGDN